MSARTASEQKYVALCTKQSHKPDQKFMSALRQQQCVVEIPHEISYLERARLVLLDRRARKEVCRLIASLIIYDWSHCP